MALSPRGGGRRPSPPRSSALRALNTGTTGLALVTLLGCGVGGSTSAAASATVDPSRPPLATSTVPTAATASPPQTGSAAPSSSATAPAATPAATPQASAATDPAVAALKRLSLSQRVGQLLMVGSPATGSTHAARDAITHRHVGNVMLTGRSTKGTAATAKVSAALRKRATSAATGKVALLVATDQEGGKVQVLRGKGFSTIPSALTQGTWSTATLRSRSTTWGRQLRAAGVNMNLAPVADTVPSRAFAAQNKPIGYYQREFGFTSSRVGSHAVAFTQGMHRAKVVVAVKHFPGLGRVTRNTDTSAGVVDRTTSRTSAYLQPFARAAAAGAPFVMMSSATYTRIDSKHPAAFSKTMITGVLRGDLRFRGVVISDDLGNARQVAKWSPGKRATMFVAAGGDMVLTVDAAKAPAMQKALLAKARSSASFRRQVDAAALRILRAKQTAGLL